MVDRSFIGGDVSDEQATVISYSHGAITLAPSDNMTNDKNTSGQTMTFYVIFEHNSF
jgi:hypothetical protein